jgi:hypothetical protein
MGEESDDNSSQVRIAIPFCAAKALAFDGYDLILALVEKLPKSAALVCNPDNPELALSVLEDECLRIHCRAYDAYTLWRVPPLCE